MKVVHLTWLMSWRGGGIPLVVKEVVAAQRRSGLDASILAAADPDLPSVTEGEVPEVLCRHRGPLMLGYAPGMLRALAELAPDLLHLHGLFTWTSAVSRGVERAGGAKVVISPHGMLEPWALANSAWKKRLFRRLVEDENLAGASCIHALSDAEAADVRALGLRCPVAVVPNGVALPERASRDGSQLAGDPVLGGKRVLLFLGRIHPKKGLLHLVEGFAATPGREGWALVLAGPDQLGHQSEVRRRAEKLGIASQVVFPGALQGTDKVAAFTAASAFILPSFSEGLPVAVLEAMSYGLPVVASRQCHLDLESCGAGLLCEPEAGSVRAQLARLFAMSDEVRASLGRAGRAEVARRYTWARVGDDLAGVYRWSLSAGPRPEFLRETA